MTRRYGLGRLDRRLCTPIYHIICKMGLRMDEITPKKQWHSRTECVSLSTSNTSWAPASILISCSRFFSMFFEAQWQEGTFEYCSTLCLPGCTHFATKSWLVSNACKHCNTGSCTRVSPAIINNQGVTAAPNCCWSAAEPRHCISYNPLKQVVRRGVSQEWPATCNIRLWHAVFLHSTHTLFLWNTYRSVGVLSSIILISCAWSLSWRCAISSLAPHRSMGRVRRSFWCPRHASDSSQCPQHYRVSKDWIYIRLGTSKAVSSWITTKKFSR